MAHDSGKFVEWTKASYALLAFAGLCFLTSFFLNMDVGSSVEQTIPLSGGDVGPIEVKEDYSVYRIAVAQTLNAYGMWSFVGGEVLDEQKEYLFGFGKELWKDRGVDYEGYAWSEQDTTFDLKVTFPKKGAYFLRFSIETNQPSGAGSVMVKVTPKQGSSLAHFILGILSLIGAVGLWMWVNVQNAPTDRRSRMIDDDEW